MFSSTIIPTIGRSTLKRAVLSVLEQDFGYDDFEVIVVNDSGNPLPDESWQNSPRVRVIETQRRERSVARNTGAAIAKGKYLHFLDDDDILLPGALDAFWKLDHQSDAIWLYGSYQTIDNDGNLVNEFHPAIVGNIFGFLIAGESIPLQASFINAKDFYIAGCFDPTLSYGEDRDLGRRLARNGDIDWSSEIVSQIRVGEIGSTSDWTIKASNDRLGREKAMLLPNSFGRLQASATSSYLRGRVSRAYFASLVWNLQHRNWFIAGSRGFAGLSLMGINILAVDFWRGLRNLHLTREIE